MTNTPQRRPHAVLDLNTRALKARKIEKLLGLGCDGSKLRLLEVGTGSGGIASYFANNCEANFQVIAVDVIDNRLVKEGYEFQLVNDVILPFEDDFFDVVITNHVIEHVGEKQSQRVHLDEVRRVLKNTGTAYLAVPNRWMLVEPHYQLMFLSWLPRKLRTPYLKLMKRGDFYDCEPLEKKELELLLHQSNFKYKNKCIDALYLTYMLELPSSIIPKIINCIPRGILDWMVFLIPTHIYILKKN